MDSESVARSLYLTFLGVPEPRSQQGRRHPLAAALTLVVLGSFNGADSLTAIADWGTRQPPRLAEAMGFPRARTSSGSTLRKILSRIDTSSFVDALRDWLGRNAAPDDVDIVWDQTARLGFRVERRRSRAMLVTEGENVGATGAVATAPPTKAVPSLRRWHRRI